MRLTNCVTLFRQAVVRRKAKLCFFNHKFDGKLHRLSAECDGFVVTFLSSGDKMVKLAGNRDPDYPLASSSWKLCGKLSSNFNFTKSSINFPQETLKYTSEVNAGLKEGVCQFPRRELFGLPQSSLFQKEKIFSKAKIMSMRKETK